MGTTIIKITVNGLSINFHTHPVGSEGYPCPGHKLNTVHCDLDNLRTLQDEVLVWKFLYQWWIFYVEHCVLGTEAVSLHIKYHHH